MTSGTGWRTVGTVILIAVLFLAVPPLARPFHPPQLSEHLPGPAPSPASNALQRAVASLGRGAGPSEGSPWSCTAASGTFSSYCGATAPAGSPPTSTWTYGGPGPRIEPYHSALMAYDPVDKYVVLAAGFGSGDSGGSGVQTWTYAAGVWSPLDLAVSPSGCPNSNMVYDSTDQYVLLVEGANCTGARTTWSFVHGAWSQLSESLPPTATSRGHNWTALANDPAENDVLLVGNDAVGARWITTTWTYRADAWSNITSQLNASPPGRVLSAISYDTAGGYVVLFGGLNGSGALNDTWEFRAGTWVPVPTPVAPPARYMPVLVDDPVDGGVLLLGGIGADERTPTSDNWLFDGATWSPIATGETYSAYLDGLSATFDPAAGGVLASYDPEGGENDVLVWEYSSGSWANITEPDFGVATASLTYDAADGYVLLCDGATWSFDAGTWTELLASGGPGSVPMTYDATDGYVLAYGGPSDTWEYVGGTWTLLTPAGAPPVIDISIPEIAYDPLEGEVLFYSALNITWGFHGGVWTNLSSTSGSPPGLPSSPLVYDPTAGGVVLVGSWKVNGSSTTFVNSTWLFSNGKWSNLVAPVPDLVIPSSGQMLTGYDTSSGTLLLFELGMTWQFEGGAWSAASVPSRDTPVSANSLVGDPETGQVLLVVNGTWWTWSAVANLSRPVVDSFALAPDPVEAGEPVTITVVAAGGTPPLSYSYLGLPGGCLTENSSVLSCTPDVAGSFPLEVVVTDANGNDSVGSANLIVVASVTVALVAVPASVAVGHRTLLEATAANGTPPYTYAYTGLPADCSSQDVPTLPCLPGLVGTDTVEVTVVDAAGGVASASAPLSVVPAGSDGGPEISAFDAAPSALVLGNDTTFSVEATEGSAVLAYSFAGLPPGCSEGNVSTFLCRPGAAGAYTVTVGVTDPSGRSAQANLDLNVGPSGSKGGPYILSFLASPSTIPLGNSTIFLVVPLAETNGSGAVTFLYRGLPVGCTSVNVTRLACAPRGAGTFTVTIVAQNGFGNRTAVSTRLTVLGVGPRPGPPSPIAYGWVGYAAVASALGATLGVAWVVNRQIRNRRRLEGNQLIEELIREDRPTGLPPAK